MELMMRRAAQVHNRGGSQSPRVEYLEQTAHSVEVRREMTEKGDLGSYGFILVQERPPIVGTIVPGGPADRAGLKKNEVVVAVNNNDITNFSHQDVVGLIANNPSPGIWLTVCEPVEAPRMNVRHYDTPPQAPSFGRVSSLGTLSMSQSTPMINRGNFSEPRRIYANDDSPPPRYSETPMNQPRVMNKSPHSVTASSINVSPLTHVYKSNGLSSSDQSFPQRISSPTPSPSAFTSANVLVLYIGAVEIPLTWRVRELSSRCLQECTRQLLSQRQEFLEVFLEVNLKSLKVLKVDQMPLFVHPREELFYCGVCTNDEQYFGVVTKKEQKGSRKGNQSNGQQPRAHMCHVFKVMQSKSVLVLKTGDQKSNQKSKTIPMTTVKPKTIPIVSCVTIINALQGLFTSNDLGGSKLFSESSSLRGSSSDQSLKVGPSLSSFSSGGSSSESISSHDKLKTKLDVVDLRPAAFSPKSRSLLTQSLPTSNPNMYVAPPQHSRTFSKEEFLPAPVTNSPLINQRRNSSQHTRSFSKEDFPLASVATPAFINQRRNSSAGSWYTADSPKENHHSRENSWESKDRPTSGNYEKYTVHVPQTQYTTSGSSGGRTSGGSGKQNFGTQGFDHLSRKVSDDSSISLSLSDPRDSPTKLGFKSRSRSGSPSPPQSLSYSSGSGSPTPLRRQRSPSPGPVPHAPRYHTPAVSKLSSGLALESSRSRLYRPVSPVGSYRGSRMPLKRQGSDSSIMEAHDYSYRTSMPQKNTALTSSFGSVATLTTIADEEVNDPDECGRVGGWVASFDKLLEDPMGVQCLLHFLEKIHCEENILFWREAQVLKQNAPQASNYLEAVKKIYDQYLSATSPSTVNVDDRVLKAVESRLANPPLNIFNEAQEQIYRLMKMDCYPRFKKSEIVKQCLIAEMEGKPLPIDPTPHEKATESQQFNGIWKKQRERGFYRSFFNKIGRKVHQEQQPSAVEPVWGVAVPDKSPDSGKKKKKDSQRRSTGKDSVSKASDGRAKKSNPDNGAAEDVRPEDHLDIFQTHKRNVFEVNLPNKVTKIMQVPDRGTVRDAIQPVLKKYGYSFDIMELRFAQNFRSVNLDLSAEILIGQHILVAKSKNTFIAAFPDQLDKILPADGSKTVGELFVRVLKEMDKLQNFQIYCEGSRVPLELSVDTSVLVGQRVIVKYLPGPCTFQPPLVIKPTLEASSSKNDLEGMDDLFSKIAQLQSDTLSDQRTSPTPHTTPEPGGHSPLSSGNSSRARSSEDLLDGSPGSRRRTASTGKRSNGHDHKMLTVSKSIGMLHHGSERHHHRDERHHHRDESHRGSSSRTQFKRVQSGSSISSSQRSIHVPMNRSVSPPASIGYDEGRRTSPPPPTSKPPPLPREVKRLNRGNQNPRWPANAKTDSVSSDDSDHSRSDRHRSSRPANDSDPRHRQAKSNSTSDHIYENRKADAPQYFPQAHPNHVDGPVYVNGSQERAKSYARNRPVNLSSLSKERNPRPSMMPSPPRDDHPLDNVVNDAAHSQRKPAHPGQKKHIQPTNLSSYPWHQAHARKQPGAGNLTSSRRRKDLTENSELIQRGNDIIKKDMDDFHSHSDVSSTHSSGKAPLSPSTHTLTLPEESGCETFV